jgi:hypothetical protein
MTRSMPGWRERIGGALVVTGQEHHLDASNDKGRNFTLYHPPYHMYDATYIGV